MKERTDAMKSPPALTALVDQVKALARQQRYQKAALLAAGAMETYPSAPQPHNLFGLLLEMQGDHISAMKHFRAAWALDPAYRPARMNMDHFGSLFPTVEWAFSEEDCPAEIR